MVLMVSPPATDFNFDSACSSPYISAPSSPRGFGDFFFSAPTSPTRASKIYREFSLSFGTKSSSSSVIPFDWEEKPGTPKSNGTHVAGEDDDDFEFEFSGPLERPSLSAEDLFDGGKIKPLKPPPRLHVEASPVSSPKSTSPSKKAFGEAFSLRKKKDFNPFTAAIEQTRRDVKQERGRERNNIYSSSNSSRRGSRSLSPLRVSQFPWEGQQQQQEQEKSTKDSISNSKQSAKGYRKWRLKDFLLFRSASEGRATDKDPLRKYAALSKKSEDVKNESFRSIDSSASSSGSVSGSSRRKGRVSAHELHYTANRAVSEELKKKTFLPYKRGLLGCLAFNPTASGLARGLNSVNR